jgi:hypothetical protein
MGFMTSFFLIAGKGVEYDPLLESKPMGLFERYFMRALAVDCAL